MFNGTARLASSPHLIPYPNQSPDAPAVTCTYTDPLYTRSVTVIAGVSCVKRATILLDKQLAALQNGEADRNLPTALQYFPKRVATLKAADKIELSSCQHNGPRGV